MKISLPSIINSAISNNTHTHTYTARKLSEVIFRRMRCMCIICVWECFTVHGHSCDDVPKKKLCGNHFYTLQWNISFNSELFSRHMATCTLALTHPTGTPFAIRFMRYFPIDQCWFSCSSHIYAIERVVRIDERVRIKPHSMQNTR